MWEDIGKFVSGFLGSFINSLIGWCTKKPEVKVEEKWENKADDIIHSDAVPDGHAISVLHDDPSWGSSTGNKK